METILMHGPAFDGSGDIVERYVVKQDVPAYVAAGYVEGENPVKTLEKTVEMITERITKSKGKK